MMVKPTHPLKTFDELLAEARTVHRLPSVSGAVAIGGRVAWVGAIGTADYEERIAADASTQYRMGSVSKTFTAAAVLLLRDRGALDLDDRLGTYLPEVSIPRVTLRQLLAHFGGVQREYPDGMWESLKFPSSADFRKALTHFEQVLPAGLHWHYSNLGFALLGEVVARASGVDYEEFVTQNLLKPRELNRTTWEPSPPVARGYFIHPYDGMALPEPAVDLGALSAAGQLWSNASDLARWGSYLAAAKDGVLAPQTLAEMHSPNAIADNTWTRGAGLGLSLIRRRNHVYGAHEGFIAGCRAAVVWFPNKGVGAAVLANSRTVTKLLDVSIALLQRTVDTPTRDEGARTSRPAPQSATPDVKGVLGRWWKEGQQYVFDWHSGGLRARQRAEDSPSEEATFTRLNPDLYRTDSGSEIGELLKVIRDGDGEVTKLYWATYPLTRDPI